MLFQPIRAPYIWKLYYNNVYRNRNIQVPSTLIPPTELFCSVSFQKRFVSTLIFFASFSPIHTTTPYPFWKRFYIVSAHAQMNSTRAHFNISAREIGAKLTPYGGVSPLFWILTVEWCGVRLCLLWWRRRFQIASFSPSTLENSVFKKHRFQIAPLWTAFWNGTVFCDRFRRCIRRITSPFSFENGLVWRGLI